MRADDPIASAFARRAIAVTVFAALTAFGCDKSSPTAPTSTPTVATTSAAPTGAQPTVSGISPPLTQGSGQQTITVAGGNLQAGVSATLKWPDGSVQSYGGAAAQLQAVTNTSLQIAATFSEPGVYTLTVTDAANQSSAPFTFTVTSPTPTVTGTSPHSPTQSTATQTIAVTGTNFETGLSVSLTGPDGSSSSLGGTAIQDITSTLFHLAAVFAQAGNYSLRVTNPYGLPSDPLVLPVQAAAVPKPVITGLSPASPTVASTSQPLYFAGTGFQTGAIVTLTAPGGGTTSFSGSAVTQSGSTTVRIAPTLTTAGAYSAQVTNPNGDVSSAWSFTVQAATVPMPVITGLSPASPTVASTSQPIYFAGTGFQTGASVTLTAPGGGTTFFSGSAVTQSGSTTVRIAPKIPTASSCETLYK